MYSTKSLQRSYRWACCLVLLLGLWTTNSIAQIGSYTFANTTRYLQIANIDEVANTTPEYFWQVIAQIVAAKADCGFLHFYDARREIIKSICFEASQIDEHAKRLIYRLKEAETMLQSLKKSL